MVNSISIMRPELVPEWSPRNLPLTPTSLTVQISCIGGKALVGMSGRQGSKKNKLKPTQVSLGSHKKVIWKCKHGHEWEASVKSRTMNGTGCPYCSHNKVMKGFNDLASQYPEVAAEWSDRNYPLTAVFRSETERRSL